MIRRLLERRCRAPYPSIVGHRCRLPAGHDGDHFDPGVGRWPAGVRVSR